MLELTPNQIQTAVNKIGYDVFAVTQENGKHLMQVWFGDEKCHGMGKIEYDDWQEGYRETYRNFYKKFLIQ